MSTVFPPPSPAAAAVPAPPGTQPPANGKPADKAPATPATGGDPHEAGKQRLRDLTKWIVGLAGGIAAAMIVGSQLTDIGDLSSDDRVSLFGWEQSRLTFAVLGLSLGLAGAATAIALAAWVQTTSFLTLDELSRYSARPRVRILGWRVKALVRRTVERELERRGVENLNRRANTRVLRAAEDWRDAREVSIERSQALEDLRNELAMARVPTTGTGDKALDWAKRQTLIDRLGVLRSAQPVLLCDDIAKALDRFEAQAVAAQENAAARSRRHRELVKLILDDASYLRLKRSFSMVLKYIVLAFAVAGCGIALYAWAAHPGEESGKPTVVVVPLDDTAPTTPVLEGCDPSTLKVQAVAGEGVLIITAESTSEDVTCTITVP